MKDRVRMTRNLLALLLVAACGSTPSRGTIEASGIQPGLGEVRSGPRNARLAVVAQEVDSILWRVRWVQPQVTGGGDDPQTYEWEADVTADPVAFSTDADQAGSVPGGTREASFWTAYACPDSLYVHARVRGHGQWREGTVTPWSEVATGSFAQDCPLPPMPPPPEVTVDTVRTDTTALDLTLIDIHCETRPEGFWADRGHPEIPDEGPTVKTQADILNMPGTEWGMRRVLLRDGDPVYQHDLPVYGWSEKKWLRLGSGFTLSADSILLEPGPGYSVLYELDPTGVVTEPDESDNLLTVSCPEVL